MECEVANALSTFVAFCDEDWLPADTELKDALDVLGGLKPSPANSETQDVLGDEERTVPTEDILADCTKVHVKHCLKNTRYLVMQFYLVR